MKTTAIINLTRDDIKIELSIPVKSKSIFGIMRDIINGIPEEVTVNNARLVSIFFFEEETKHG